MCPPWANLCDSRRPPLLWRPKSSPGVSDSDPSLHQQTNERLMSPKGSIVYKHIKQICCRGEKCYTQICSNPSRSPPGQDNYKCKIMTWCETWVDACCWTTTAFHQLFQKIMSNCALSSPLHGVLPGRLITWQEHGKKKCNSTDPGCTEPELWP